jgi:hypothetical protein
MVLIGLFSKLFTLVAVERKLYYNGESDSSVYNVLCVCVCVSVAVLHVLWKADFFGKWRLLQWFRAAEKYKMRLERVGLRNVVKCRKLRAREFCDRLVQRKFRKGEQFEGKGMQRCDTVTKRTKIWIFNNWQLWPGV